MAMPKGTKLSEKHKQKISIALKGRMPKNIKQLINSPGKFKKNQTSWNKNKKEIRPEVLKKMSDSRLGKVPWNKGTGRPITRTGRDTKFKKGMNGPLSPAWKGGTTKLQMAVRTCEEYLLWHNKVFKRDDYTCQLCNKQGCYLEVHHKKPLATILKEKDIIDFKSAKKCKELFDVKNGITLCLDCHCKIDKNRARTRRKI